MSAPLVGLYVMEPGVMDDVYGPAERARIERHVRFDHPVMSGRDLAAHPECMRGVDVIFSSWGGPKLEGPVLAAADRLKAFFYGAGTVKGLISDAAWERGIVVTSAFGANALPVVEFTIAQIIMCLKKVWQAAALAKQERRLERPADNIGCYGSTVGLVSLGAIGRHVARRLRDNFELKVIAYDPFLPANVAAELGVELVDLDTLFAAADVVSLHTPWLKETEKMIRGAHFRRMKPHASFLNTARGAIVDESEMVAALAERPDLFALLDVTYPEPPAADSPLWTMHNVVLTPHIAGSMGLECRRMGRFMAEELERYIAGAPLQWRVTREMTARMA